MKETEHTPVPQFPISDALNNLFDCLRRGIPYDKALSRFDSAMTAGKPDCLVPVGNSHACLLAESILHESKSGPSPGAMQAANAILDKYESWLRSRVTSDELALLIDAALAGKAQP